MNDNFVSKPYGYLRLKDAKFFYEVDANDERILQMGFVPLYDHSIQPVQPAIAQDAFNAKSFGILWSNYCDKKMEIEDLKSVNEQLLEALRKVTEVNCDTPVKTYQEMERIAKAAIEAANGVKND